MRLIVVMCACVTTAAVQAQDTTGNIEFFEREVRPLLATHCFGCHSTDSDQVKGGLRLDSREAAFRGGDSGPAIIQGEPTASLLVTAIEYASDLKMPPDTKLREQEIAILTRWVHIGAPWPNSPTPPDVSKGKFSLEQRKRDHWCWQPIQKPAIPAVTNTNWLHSPIDTFVLRRLESRELQPAAPADRYTWLRRASFDLIGIPPTPDEITDFGDDQSPLAYEKVVDRLVSSPHFGEHWARHWMDLVRYAETKGFASDYTMPYVHRYRDYLIRAFNFDVPYDQFVQEAIAGDLLLKPRHNLADGSLESVMGPGYFYLYDSHHGPPDIHGFEARAFDNMIDATSKTFLALTLACARCHDHKFDALTSRDYYSLYGILASSRFHYANTVSPDVLQRSRQRLVARKLDLKHRLVDRLLVEARTLRAEVALSGSLNALADYPGWDALLQAHHAETPLGPAVKLLAAESTALEETWESMASMAVKAVTEAPENIGGLDRTSLGRWLPSGIGFGTAPVTPGAFTIPPGDDKPKATLAYGAAAGLLTSRFDGSIKSPTFTLENAVSVRMKGRRARVRLFVRHYELVGKGVTTGKLDQKVGSDTWKWITFDTRLWKGQPAYLEILHNGDQMEIVYLKQHETTHSEDAYVAIDRAIIGRRPDELAGRFERAWRIDGPPPANRAETATRLVQTLAAMLGRWRQDTLSTAGAEVIESLLNQGLLERLLAQDPQLNRTVELSWLASREPPQPVYVRTLADGHGHDEPVYVRGNHKMSSECAVPRHFLDVLDATPLSEGSGRRQWAEAIVHPTNTLTARVIVNRIWGHMFGRGLVPTVDNFGVMGEPPTHPELLDYLAHRLMNEGWSLKRIIRSMVLSRTYQMSSRVSPRARQVDPHNVCLSHIPVRRLTAESIRDTILLASGRLNRRMYGRSVPLNLEHATPSEAKPTKNGPIDGYGRRSVYLEVRRNYLPAFLRAFDLPNATATRGRRAVTNVPAQALALMNDPFVVEQSKVWATRIAACVDASLKDRVQALHLAAFGRAARASELRQIETIVDDLAEKLDLTQSVAVNDVRVWTQICHLMINRKEFVFLF